MPTMACRRQAHPTAWYGRELDRSDSWTHVLSVSEIAELEAALAATQTRQLEPHQVSRTDFPLPEFGRILAGLGRELDLGRGFTLIRGLPVDRYSGSETEMILVGMSSHLGTLVRQGAGGDVVVHVRDEGYGLERPTVTVRGYQTRTELDFHTDGGDVVGLLCLHTAKTGGVSRLVSSLTVVGELAERRPDLVDLLFRPWYFDRRDMQPPGEAPFFATPMCSSYDGLLSFKHTPRFVYSAQRHPQVPRLTEAQRELLELIEAVAEEPGVALEMTFSPGDLQFVNNYSVMHARSRYEDWDEPERRRHLLRVWIALRNGRRLAPEFVDF